MTPTSPSSARGRRAALSLAALAATLLVALPGTALAEPDNDEVDIDELNRRAEELEESYDGELLQFNEIKDRVEKAEQDLEEVEERLDASRNGVSTIASTQYKSGSGLDPAFRVIFSSDPESMFADAATLNYLGQSQSEQISDLVRTRDEAALVTEELQTELAEAEKLIETLEEEREEVEARIAEYEAEQVPETPESATTPGSGTIPDSAKGWGWDGATPRMAAIRDEIVQNFGAPYPVGCLRSSADDHGVGRACDFMMSAGGARPSAANQSLGAQISQYGIDNADRLGIKYIIWEQQIWHSTSRQWTWMEDRGDNTQNHYDHVHISSY
jgi:septal ring factor EnvC (AmiA/AmiB activator)